MKGLALIEEDRTPDKYDLSVMLDGEKVGQLLLSLKYRGKQFFIYNLEVESGKRSARLMGHVLIEGLKNVQREYGVASIEMYKFYPETRAEEDDPWLKVARSVIGLRVERQDSERALFVSMKHGNWQNQAQLYTTERLEREGFTFLSFAECDERLRREIEAVRAEMPEDGVRLPTNCKRLDEDLTTIGLYHGEVCSWMILERLSKDEVRCHSWYAVKKFRRVAAGTRLSMHVLQYISKEFDRMQWSVKLKDVAVLRYYMNFFRDSIEKIDYGYRYSWTLRRTER